MSTEIKSTKVVTGLVRFSYMKVWDPEVDKNGKKYSTAIIIPKSDKETIAKIKEAVALAKEQGVAKLGGKIPANLKTPLRDGDEEKADDEAYENSYFLNASTRNKPGIVDKNTDPILDQDEVYSGCYGRVSLNFYAYNTDGNKGIAAGLNNIMKVKDGEALAGSSSAAEDFADILGENDDLLD